MTFSSVKFIKMLRTVFLLAAVAVTQHLVTGQDVPGKLAKSRRSFSSAVNWPTSCNSTGHYVQCDSCSSYMVCLAGMQSNRVCPGNRPYCNNNQCSANPDFRTCPVPSINCTGAGFYPDPKACQFYHYCPTNGMPSDVYECPQNYYFNPESTLCSRNGAEPVCVTVHCDPDKILQRYGNSSQYFAFCRDQEILMAKCDNNHVFTGTGCVFQCPWEGLLPHPVRTKYYSCYYSGANLVAQELSCPPNRVFNAFKRVCV